MGKRDTMSIDAAKFEAILLENGVVPKEQAGFMKCEIVQGRTLYITKTRRVARVDISGFKMEADSGVDVIELGGSKFGAVEQQLDFKPKEGETDEQTEARVISNFGKIIAYAKTLAPRVREKNPEKAAAAKKAESKGWTSKDAKNKEQKAGEPVKEELVNAKNVPMSQLTALEDKLVRLLNIKKVSEEKGVAVSKKTLENLANTQAAIAALKGESEGDVKTEQAEENVAAVA